MVSNVSTIRRNSDALSEDVVVRWADVGCGTGIVFVVGVLLCLIPFSTAIADESVVAAGVADVAGEVGSVD